MGIGGERERLQKETGFVDSGREEVRRGLGAAARDMMTFAGLVRYRLERGVWEMVVRAGGDVGGY